MSEILLLDVRTLAFVSAVGGFLMAAAMYGIYVAGMRERCLIDWAWAGAATGGGFLIGHILQTIAVPIPAWMVAAVANALIALGHGMLLVGVQRYLGKRCWTGLVLAVAAAMLVSGFIFPELRETLRLRIVFHSGWYALVDTYAGILLLRSARPQMQRFHWFVAAVLLPYAAFLWVRLGYAVASAALTTSFTQDPFQAANFLLAMIFGFAIAIALALMMFREKQLELLRLAERDPLTGMLNRLSMDKAVARSIEIAERDRSPLSVMILDIDHFKEINDEYGHQVGDHALQAVARRIREETREHDKAFRYGGEEFMLLLPATDAEMLEAIAERLRKAVARSALQVDGENIPISASIGGTEFHFERESWETCLKRADDAMYRAKCAGRNRVTLAIGPRRDDAESTIGLSLTPSRDAVGEYAGFKEI